MAKRYSKTLLSTISNSNLAKHQDFSAVFHLAHNTLEYFVCDTGIYMGRVVWDPNLVVPVVDASAKYSKEIYPGKELTTSVSVLRVGNTSTTIEYKFTQNDELNCVVRLVHVFVNTKSNSKTEIPESIRAILNEYTA